PAWAGHRLDQPGGSRCRTPVTSLASASVIEPTGRFKLGWVSERAGSSDAAARRPTLWPGDEIPLIDGSRLFVRHAQPARPGLPPAVLIHGLGGSSLNWIALMDQLTDVFDQWAPDLPGFGESPPGRRHTIGSYVRVVVEYIERFSGPVHLVGNSMGGLIA